MLSYSILFENIEYAIKEVVKIEKAVKYWNYLEIHNGIINIFVNLIIDDMLKASHKTLGATKYIFKLSIKVRPTILNNGVNIPMNNGDVNI